MRTIAKIFLLLGCVYSYAQTTISGTVKDDTGQPLPSANIIVVGTSQGTVADFDGGYILTVDLSPPFQIQASSIGFETVVKEVTTNPQIIDCFCQSLIILLHGDCRLATPTFDFRLASKV